MNLYIKEGRPDMRSPMSWLEYTITKALENPHERNSPMLAFAASTHESQTFSRPTRLKTFCNIKTMDYLWRPAQSQGAVISRAMVGRCRPDVTGCHSSILQDWGAGGARGGAPLLQRTGLALLQVWLLAKWAVRVRPATLPLPKPAAPPLPTKPRHIRT